MKSTKRKPKPDDMGTEDPSPRFLYRPARQRGLGPPAKKTPRTLTDWCQDEETRPTQLGIDKPTWWKKPVPALTKEIWLPSDRDALCPARSIQLEGKSWFNLNNIREPPTTNDVVSQLPTTNGVVSKPSDEKRVVNNTLKVRLYPTKPQKTLLNKMFGTHRAIYNMLVETPREDCYKISMKERAAKYRQISREHSLANNLPEYHRKVPEEVMISTYRDYEGAIKSSNALFKKLPEGSEKTRFPKLKLKTKKDNSSTIELRARDIVSRREHVTFFPDYFDFAKGEGIEIRQKLPKIEFALRLQRTRDAKFYLCVPYSRVPEKTTSTRVCAIDPGIRSFITVYDPEKMTMGVDDKHNKIFRRCSMIDRVIAKRDKETSKRKRYRQSKRIRHTFRRAAAMIDDMHQKVSSWLSKNYSKVLLPSFEPADMTSQQQKISSKRAREMLTWSHNKFKKMLEYKMARSGGKMIECEEIYTTKTCTRCGIINRKITYGKVFSCSECALTMDRDVNAARNIYLMNKGKLS